VVKEPKKPIVKKFTKSLFMFNLLLIIAKTIPIKKLPKRLHNIIPFGEDRNIFETKNLLIAPMEPPKAIKK